MPLLGTRAAASSKGFGLLSGGKLTTVSLSGSGTWVAPTGVTSVNAVLVGGPLTPPFWSTPTMSAQGSWVSSSSPTVASMEAAADAWIANAGPIFDAGAPGVRTVSGRVGEITYTLSNGDVTSVYDNNTFSSPSGVYTIRGSFSTVAWQALNVNYGGKLFFKPSGNFPVPDFEILSDCVNGGPTSMFGQTAAGGACPSGSPATVTISNQPVIAGSGYSYSVASGGSLTLTYIAPA